ncbi:MAG: hypothetical protein LWW85_15410, partial [Marinilabiliales bacterium]|nr:hypothetical protein [Marinilabiliales bacterium]
MNRHFLPALSLFLLMHVVSAQRCAAQNVASDSLELTPLIKRVIETYPTVKQANEALKAADI